MIDTPIIPFIHTGGTSKEWLIETRCNAAKAIREAYESVQAQAPNPRDFYPYQDPGAFIRAREIHNQRLQVLRDIRDALMVEAEAISDGPGLRYDNLLRAIVGALEDR